MAGKVAGWTSVPKRERSEWLKTPEGKDFFDGLKKFDSIQEFCENVKAIRPIDFSSSETSVEEAIEHGRQILTALVKARILDLISNHHLVYVSLKNAGCVPFENANKKFLVGHSLEEMICTNSPSFPLALYTQLLDLNPDVFAYAIQKALGVTAKDSGWAMQWLATQKIVEQKKFVKKVNVKINNKVKIVCQKKYQQVKN